MKYLLGFLILLLIVLHQDYWQWDNGSLLGGFLPYSLAYHAGISLAAAAVWALAVKFCWPQGLEDLPTEEGAADDLSAEPEAPA